MTISEREYREGVCNLALIVGAVGLTSLVVGMPIAIYYEVQRSTEGQEQVLPAPETGDRQQDYIIPYSSIETTSTSQSA